MTRVSIFNGNLHNYAHMRENVYNDLITDEILQKIGEIQI